MSMIKLTITKFTGVGTPTVVQVTEGIEAQAAPNKDRILRLVPNDR
jgi:hypothetical protein